jgi:hypothetical protein
MAMENGVLDELEELEELVVSVAVVESVLLLLELLLLELLELLLLEDEKMSAVPVLFTAIDVAMPIPLSGFSNSSGTCCAVPPVST